MRRAVALAASLGLTASILALAAGPAAAQADEDWGFVHIIPGSAAPGSAIVGLPHSDEVWESYDRAADRFDSPRAAIEEAACGETGRLGLYTREGRRIATASRSPVVIPAGTAPGTYVLRVECRLGEAGEITATACADFEVLASGRGPDRDAITEGGLMRDPCPTIAPDSWGFTNITPGSGPPGTDILAFLNSRSAWDSSDPATETFSEEYRANFAACLSNARADLLDRFGARIDTTDPLLTVPRATEPGNYSIFLGCFVDGQLRSACANFEVTVGAPSGPSGRQPAHPGPLISDPCPISVVSVVDRTFLRAHSAFRGLGSRIFSLSPPVSGPSVTTTTGARQQTSGSSPPPAAGDSAGPTIGGVGVSPNPIWETDSGTKCPAGFEPSIATVTAPVSDPSGVGSVTMSWPGGSKSMSGGATRSATIGPFPTTTTSTSTVITITITATDAVGNVSTKQASVTVNDCTLI